MVNKKKINKIMSLMKVDWRSKTTLFKQAIKIFKIVTSINVFNLRHNSKKFN